MAHSNYWLDRDLFADDDTDTKTTSKTSEAQDLAKIARYAAVRRAISNFVSILSGKNIPVEFSSGKDSYTDGERIVISAEDDPEKFDVMVGLALHEASHVLLTDFEFMKHLQSHKDSYRTYRVPMGYWVGQTLSNDIAHYVFPKGITTLFPERIPYGTYGHSYDYDRDVKYCTAVSQAFNDVHMLMNILEDRRIDKWVYTRAGGYRPYYQALYNRYFFTGEVGKNLRFNPAWRELTVENYLNRLLYSFHPASNPDAMPMLRQMIDYMDLPNIDRIAPVTDKPWMINPSFDNTPKLWQEACILYMMILKVVGLSVTMKEQPQTPTNGEPSNATTGNPLVDAMLEDENRMGDLPNLDLDGAPQPMPVEKDVKGKGKKQQEVEGKYNEKKAEKELADAKKVLDGNVKKKKMNKNTQASVTALEEAAGEMVDIDGYGIPKAKCFVTKKLTARLMEQDWFIFGSRWSDDRSTRAIAAGKRMGQILHNRLQVRNDPVFTKQTRLPMGGMDRRLLAQLGMDITNVFQKTRVDTHKPAMLHLSLDASGSMCGSKWYKVQTVATALAYLGTKLRSVDTVISIRGGNNLPVVAVLFDSRKDQINSFYKNFVHIRPSGATPEGLCYRATMDLVTECAETHAVYFINFSDGEPSFYVSGNAGIVSNNKGNGYYGLSYAGDVAFKHTRQMMNLMREKGVQILSYFISEHNPRWPNQNVNTVNAFKKMYGEDASFVNVENAGEVLNTLNRLLRERGT